MQLLFTKISQNEQNKEQRISTKHSLALAKSASWVDNVKVKFLVRERKKNTF